MRIPMLSASATSASMCYLRQCGTETSPADRSAGWRDGRGARTFGGNSPATLRPATHSVKLIGSRTCASPNPKPLSRWALRRLTWSCASFLLPVLALSPAPVRAQAAGPDTPRAVVLAPAAVWDGTADAPRRGWVVVVRGQRIEAVGPEAGSSAPAGAERI